MMKLPLRLYVATACAAAVMVGLMHTVSRAQSADPAALPLLTQANLKYVGGFRLPAEAINGADFAYGGSPVAYNPVNNSLFIGKDNNITEVSIPTPVDTADPKRMPMSTYVQRVFTDPTEGHLRDVSKSDVVLYGLLVQDGKLHGAVSIYYDASVSQRISHFSRSLNLTQPSFSGWSQVWESGKAGFVGGWMAAIPSEWQTKLGGTAITGQCCIPIITRTSFGPAAFAFDPALIGQKTVPASPLLYYDDSHPTLGRWEDSNPAFGMATRMGGVAVIAGTRTALFIGSHGLGPACYGEGTADKAAADASSKDELCFDPSDGNKGTHAYPYQYQVWAYDLNDFAAVKAKRKRPWEIKPYGLWALKFPAATGVTRIGGVGYDQQRQIIYLSQRDANQGEYTSSPLIQAVHLEVGGGKQ